MQEDILTSEEIKAIIEEAGSERWEHPNLIGPSSKKASIFRISHISNLIMINGNEWTGVNHIQHRHRFGRQVWREDKEKLSDTSEMRIGVAPIDFLKIAESIYRPENLRNELNIRPNDFDLYLGNHIHLNGDSIQYRLLTYKGTGVVHTLFPTKSQNRRKKLLQYRQGGTHWSWNLMRARHIYTIPYYNKADQVIFKIIVLGRDHYPIERIYIEIVEGGNVNPQVIFIKEFVYDNPPDHGAIRSAMIEYFNKSVLEQAADQILKGVYKADLKEKLHLLERRKPDTVLSFFAW